MNKMFEKLEYKTAVALGAFDGVHLGHIEVIKNTIGREGLTPLVFTFSGDTPLPKTMGEGGSLLTTFSQKEKIIKNLGIEVIYAPKFDDIKDTAPETFVLDIMRDTLNAGYVVCGYDFTFGREAKGNAQLLAVLCRKIGIECDIVPEIKIDGMTLSSTNIRSLIREGAAAAACRLMGRPYSFTETVIRGTQLGRTIGFPTINQKIPPVMVQPAYGVYASRVTIDGVEYGGITDIGVKPTVKDDEEVITETYIIDFDGDLYDKEVTVSLLFFIRGEKKFYDLEGLRTQLAEDLEYAKTH